METQHQRARAPLATFRGGPVRGSGSRSMKNQTRRVRKVQRHKLVKVWTLSQARTKIPPLGLRTKGVGTQRETRTRGQYGSVPGQERKE